jgi:hypothetical protein
VPEPRANTQQKCASLIRKGDRPRMYLDEQGSEHGCEET